MESIPWHRLSIDETLDKLSTHHNGLTQAEANERLVKYGRNEIIRRKPISPVRLFIKQFANFFIFVLLFAAVLDYFISYLPIV